MFPSRGVVLFLMSAAVCGSAMADSGLSTTLELGYRVDSLDWNIAGDSSGANPNILSELSWTHLRISQARIKLDSHTGDLHLLGSAAYGQINSGDNQDSDYDFDDRLDEFSRSNNRGGGDVMDVNIGVGRLFEANAENGRNGYVMPMAGFSMHQQNLKMTDGYQTISTDGRTPPLGTLAGLDSSYDAQWLSGWVGVRFMENDVQRGLRISFDMVYHWVDYDAEANWNLREDFEHPKSFEHDARGHGLIFSLNGVSRLSTHWDWTFGLDYGTWSADDGVDTVYLVRDGMRQIVQTRLNEVNWESFAVNLGLALRL